MNAELPAKSVKGKIFFSAGWISAKMNQKNWLEPVEYVQLSTSQQFVFENRNVIMKSAVLKWIDFFRSDAAFSFHIQLYKHVLFRHGRLHACHLYRQPYKHGLSFQRLKQRQMA
jgi:hypothetical protein